LAFLNDDDSSFGGDYDASDAHSNLYDDDDDDEPVDGALCWAWSETGVVGMCSERLHFEHMMAN
jgi:hypothetical protein